MIETLGFIAAVLTTGAFLPQAWKTVRTKNTSGISLPMYCFLMIGLILWVIYGYMIDSKPIFYANVVTATFSAIILFYTLKNAIRSKDR